MVHLGRVETSVLATAPQREEAKTLDAARQFEALLVAQMLKTVHEAGGGWLGTGEDSSATPALEYAQEQFAQALCATGGLGLAKMVARGLTEQAKEAAKPPSTNTAE
jgi:Rod binding domain-containing protein